MKIKNLSYSLQFAVLRAGAEAEYAHCTSPGIEYWFLGILKLSELKAKDAFRLPESELKAIDADIEAVKAALQEYGIDSGTLRARLRHALKHGAKSDPDSIDKYLEPALKAAKLRGQENVWAIDLLRVLLETPTDTLKDYLPQKEKKEEKPEKANGPVDKKEEKADPSPSSAQGRDFLPALTEKVRNLRASLLNTVQGQDHVVHAFAEGIFAAEVLAAADEKRVRPRAIFAFVGPPGVGKTFLAEQAAKNLGLPYQRFDMSTYADHQSYMGLVGFEPSYKDAKEGLLTGFVKKNPTCILLFDEIEKAHLNTVQLFLQILDAGHLADRFLSEDVSFKDTIIIFTSNAGKMLYEGEARQNAAGVPRKVLLNALETEKDPRTGNPFFPPAITSRLATGWPLLFNHLEPHDLELISRREFDRLCALFKKQYGLEVTFDPVISTALLFGEGGAVDARTLRAQTELFFKNEIFKVCRLWGEERFPQVLARLQHIRFVMETENFPEDVRSLFFSDEKPEVLLYGSPYFVSMCRRKLPEFVFHGTDNIEEALEIAGEKDIRLAIVDITERSRNLDNFLSTVAVNGQGGYIFLRLMNCLLMKN